MAKTVRIEVVEGCVHYGGKEYLPGDDFDCSVKEAKRLKELGVCADPAFYDPSAADETPEEGDTELLAAIAAATTPEELSALMPETKPSAEVVEAFEKRHTELAAV